MTEGSHEPTYKCLSNDGLKKLISLNPIDHLKLEQKRRIQKNMFIVNNKYYVCPHGHLHPLKEIFGKNYHRKEPVTNLSKTSWWK